MAYLIEINCDRVIKYMGAIPKTNLRTSYGYYIGQKVINVPEMRVETICGIVLVAMDINNLSDTDTVIINTIQGGPEGYCKYRTYVQYPMQCGPLVDYAKMKEMFSPADETVVEEEED